MIKLTNLPADQYAYMQMENRWANWPKKIAIMQLKLN
jgi:hypothetical protein